MVTMEGGFLQALLMGFLLMISCLVLNHLFPLLLNLRATPRGSFGWRLVGETLSFLSPHKSNTLGSFLEDHISRYGRVFRSHLFCSPTIVSCDEELNHFVLQNEDKLFQCSYPKPIHGILGKFSMIVAVGETHKRLRNLALTLVTTIKSRPGYLDDIEKIAVNIMDSWKNKRSVLFCEEARKFTFSVIVNQVLGLSQDEPQSARILGDFLTFMKGLISLPICVPGSPYARAVKARTRIYSSVKAIIEERRKNGGDCNKKGDFFDVLLSLDHNVSEEEKVSFVLDALLGGYETTSLLMSMAVHFLGHCPTSLEQLKSEHWSIRANKKRDESLNLEDYRKMDFTQCVINEALRCGNIVKFVHRKALKDIRFKGHLIPSGWKVLPVFSAVHLNPTLHQSALQFNPYRWKDQNQATCKRLTPFGGGSRLCPGSELGKVETAVFLHHLVLKFRWKVDCEDFPMAYPYVEFPRSLSLRVDPILQDFS